MWRAARVTTLRGSLASLERQNERIEADGLERILDEEDLESRIEHKLLVPLPASAALAVNPNLSETHRYCRPWTARFLADLARAHFFYARVLRSDGNYDGAAAELQKVLAQYPKDRVVRDDLGRVYFLERKYQDAIAQLNEAIAIDPEDLQANYNLMLCYRGLGDNERAAGYGKRYLRFKADESSQALTGQYRRTHPEDNNERQGVHEHVSVPLAAPPKSPARKLAASHPSTIPNGGAR